MKYKNANSILPEELIENIQQYVQGEYIYIPIKNRAEASQPTEYDVELQKRDEHIYTRHLEGIPNKKLAEMYCLSESSIRRIVVNQRKRYDEMKDRIGSIMQNWNMEDYKAVQIYDTAWQIGDNYILKVYDDVNLIERNIKILSILGDRNIPVGKLVYTKDKTTFAKDEQYYYILSEKLKGSNIISIKETSGIGTEMGKIIADLHIAFKECEKQDEFWDNSLLEEMKGWIKEVFCENGWKYIEESLFEETVSRLEALYDKLPVQLIHRDVHFGNFLFDNGTFSGYIDFDLSQRNIRIFDLCYFVLGLLSEEDKLEVTSEEWFSVLKDVFEGYNSKLQLSEEERMAVPYVMKSIELLFAAWFLGQNDIKCVESAMKIFLFVDENQEEILAGW